ncbi:hypothetical protein [Pelosinus baikalensis]|uniref:Uncharacterized protein n=1 Tax=Pelosinus baikalensis TaxID=2892015 RepID=A0ABS8HQW3_9FIRM|nr:hypothetical protein [Pelosinus baikalensis]MCC5465555.1 hypothetical protein [Pelosinus baikalensis]
MGDKLVIVFNGAVLFVTDKAEQKKIYRWFTLGNEQTAFVTAHSSFGNRKSEQEHIINRNNVSFMTFEDDQL